MALTLAEADKYSTNEVLVGVAEITMDQNPLLGLLPFIPIRGNALQYQRELAASAPTFIAARGTATDSDGPHQIIQDAVTPQQVHAGATTVPGVGTFTLLRELIDMIRPRPTVLIMSRRTRRGIQKLAVSQGWDLALTTIAGIDRQVQTFNEVPILACDFITDTETITSAAFLAETGGTASSIFACRLAEDGLFGISADDPNAQDDLERIIQVEEVGALETQAARRTRLKAYTALSVKASQAVARIDGISSGDWTN